MPTVNVTARDQAGNATTATASYSVSPTKRIIYGLNTREDAVNDMRLGDRTAANGWVAEPGGDGLYEGQNIGMSRCYYTGALPAAFDIAATTGGFGTNFKKRVNICWKGAASPAKILDKSSDAMFINFVNSIPEGWEVAMTWFHEPNAELGAGQFTATAYRNAHRRLGALLDGRIPDAAAGGAKAVGAPALNVKTGVNVYNAVCYTIWRGTTSNQWAACQASIPDAADMDVKAILLLDAYQNTPPGGSGANGTIDGPAGADWKSLYPTGAAVWTFYFNSVHSVYGYDQGQHGYGVGEWMAPARLHDGNVNMQGTDDPTKPWQALAVEDYLNYLESRPQGPRMILMWENPAGQVNAGASFEQKAHPKARAVFARHANGPYAI